MIPGLNCIFRSIFNVCNFSSYILSDILVTVFLLLKTYDIFKEVILFEIFLLTKSKKLYELFQLLVFILIEGEKRGGPRVDNITGQMFVKSQKKFMLVSKMVETKKNDCLVHFTTSPPPLVLKG